MTYRLDLCNEYAKIGDTSSFRFRGSLLPSATGEFTVDFTAPRFESDATVDDVNSVILWDTTGIDQIVYGGLAVPTGSSDAGLRRQVRPDGVLYRLSGVDVFGVLDTRLTFPDPAEAAPADWSTSHDTRSGAGSTVAAGYITHNLGSSALTARQPGGIATVTVVDPTIGDTVDWSSRLEPLGVTVGKICRATGIVCVASMPTPGELTYTFRSPSDRSASTVLSEHGSSVEAEIIAATTSGSWVTAGGSGTGISRLFAVSDDGATGLDRVEAFYDVNNLTAQSAVDAAARGDRLRRAAATGTRLRRGATVALTYPGDYELGDLIRLKYGEVTETVRVDGVSFDVSDNYSAVLPIIGRPANDDATRLLRQVNSTSVLLQGSVL